MLEFWNRELSVSINRNHINVKFSKWGIPSNKKVYGLVYPIQYQSLTVLVLSLLEPYFLFLGLSLTSLKTKSFN